MSCAPTRCQSSGVQRGRADSHRRPRVRDESRLAEVERMRLNIAPTEYRIVDQAVLAREADE